MVLVALSVALAVSADSASGWSADYALRVNPGGSSTLDHLTCGWHTGACYDQVVGDALDWDNEDNATVYWRSFGNCSQACGTVATGTIEYAEPYCTETRVRVRDLQGRDLGRIVYTHTTTSQQGAEFLIQGAGAGWGSTTVGIGTSLTEEICVEFSGSHVHQYHREGDWTKNPQYPDTPGSGYYDVLALGNYQVETSWTAPAPDLGYDTVGVYREGAWYLRNALGGPSGPGWPDCAFVYGDAADTPLMGDCDGDGVDTVGVWRSARWTSEG